MKNLLEGEGGIEEKIGEYQFGFRKKKGVEECSLALKALDEIEYRKGNALASCFLDIKKAYDTIPHDVVAASLKRLDVHPRLTRFLHNWCRGHERKLLIPNNSENSWLKVSRGVPQGSAIAPLLFSCVMDTLREHMNGEPVLGNTLSLIHI